jgi:thiol peroxidase
MGAITLKGSPVTTVGSLPKNGSVAPSFLLTKTDLTDVSIKDFAGKKVVLNIFPSLDTSTCAASVRRFNKMASELQNTVVLCISADLPFAHKRFCTTEGLDNVVTLSTFRDQHFGKDYGVTILDSGLKGLLARAVVVVNESGVVVYSEQVPEIAQEPNYDAALSAIK